MMKVNFIYNYNFTVNITVNLDYCVLVYISYYSITKLCLFTRLFFYEMTVHNQ